jgi:hypothetical protein
MTINKKLQIWTVFLHGFIVIGAGHGIGFLFLVEIISFPYFGEDGFTLLLTDTKGHLPVIGLTMLLGQCAMTVSIASKIYRTKFIAQTVGLFFLWTSLIYFVYDTFKDHYVGIAVITCLPFLVCATLILCGRPLKRFYNWARDNY